MSLENNAEKVLLNNFQEGGYTIPCEGLYPFQWKWDSGFIAIGLAHFDLDKAEQEIESLFKGQWSNGMIPHIVFHKNSDTYFPGPDFHQSKLSPHAPIVPTTGMVQPPVLGFVLEEMLRITKDESRTLKFIAKIIDKVYHNHEYFYTHRDPNNEGLAYIYHNWESGTDNSPPWDEIWQNMDSPKYTFERRDTKHVNPEQRPTNEEYNNYIHLIELAKKVNYNDEKIAKISPFLIQDPLFNAILIKSNESLIKLYKTLNIAEEKIEQLKQWQVKSKKSFNEKLWSEEKEAYVYFDMRTNKQLEYVSSSSFVALFGNIPDQEKEDKLLARFASNFGANHYLCASFDTQSAHFNPKKYWRGPIWINLNWMIYKGLKLKGYTNLANQVKQDSLHLLEKHGFYEYFDPRKEVENAAYGGNNFSWSAALCIDFLNEK